MPRPVVPMAFTPRARSRAWSSMACEGRMSGQCGETASRSNTGTPCSLSMWLSASSASSDNTTPLPMKQRTCSRRIPEGMSDRMVLRPPMTSVWPALCPPWKRATAAARSVSRSTTLPLPSSPHWAPMMTTNFPTPPDPYRTRNRMMTPTSMLPRPAMRNSRSRVSKSLANARFTPWGLRNGAMPSNTRNSPSAASRSVRFTGQPAARALAPRGSRFRRIFQILEEIPVGRHHQQVAVLAERALVSLQAAIEGVELGVLRVGARVGLGRGGVAFATHAQRIAFRLGEDHGALALGGGADAGAGALALGAQAARGLGEALLHALVDARRHLVGEVDALHAHVHQVNSQSGRIAARLTKHLTGDRGTLGGYDLLQRALRHHALDPVLDDLRQALAGQFNQSAGGGEVQRRVPHAPLHVEVHDQAAAVVRQERLAGVGLRQNAAVEFGHHVPRPLRMQPGRVIDAHDLAELGANGELGFGYREQRQRGEHHQHTGADQRREQPRVHQRSPRPRASTVTESGSFGAPPAGASAPCSASRAAPFSSSLSIGR